MIDNDHPQSDPAESCGCFTALGQFLVLDKELGMDSNFALASLLVCRWCGQDWLRYLYEIEAFTASGRWYLGAIPVEQTSNLAAEDAKALLEGLSWYFFGGSYYGGGSGRTSGRINLNP